MFRIDVLAIVLISEEHNDLHSSSSQPVGAIALLVSVL